ncbi:hypothetical protein [Defluviitalea phaphyphila]|uniref:hypothetical protein n=1 Tax=Defluviitalea phaphyphila TaxID=1473580 RepID=UPI0007300C7A|nr:hypothetical protein [Defluviitalea phaphyphila]
MIQYKEIYKKIFFKLLEELLFILIFIFIIMGIYIPIKNILNKTNKGKETIKINISKEEIKSSILDMDKDKIII